MTHNSLRSRAKAIKGEPSSSPFAHTLISSAAAITGAHEVDSPLCSSSMSALCSEGESESSSAARKRARECVLSLPCEEGVSAKKNRPAEEDQDPFAEDTDPLSSPSDDPADCEEEALPSTRVIPAVKREEPLGEEVIGCDGVVLNWERIIERFDRAFDQNFSTNKKAHFDSLPAEWSPDTKIVDGARGRWRRLLALDALLYLLQHDDFDLSVRRNFNQQRQLVHCIFVELHAHSPRLLLELLEARGAEQEERDLDVGCARVTLEDSLNSPSAGSPSFASSSFAAVTPTPMDPTLSLAPHSALARSLQQKLKLVPVGAEWRSLAVMKEKLGADVPAKSRRKFENCVNALCGHKLLTPHCMDLTPVLLKAIERALFLFPVLASVSELATETQRKIFGRSLAAAEEITHGLHLEINKTKKSAVPLSTRRSRPVSLSSYTLRQTTHKKSHQKKRDAKKSGTGKKRRSSSYDTSDSEDHEEIEIASDSEENTSKVKFANDSDDEDGCGTTRSRRKSEKRRQMEEATRERFKQALKMSSSPAKTTKTFVVTPDNAKEDTGPSTWFTAERDFEPLIAFLDDDSSDESNDAFSFRFDGETKEEFKSADSNKSHLTQKVAETIPEENESLNASRYHFSSLSSTHSFVTIIPPSPEPAFDEI